MPTMATTTDIVIKSITKVISNEDLLSLPSNPLEVIPAPEAGSFVLVEKFIFRNTSNILNGYENIDPDASLQLVYGAGWVDNASKSRGNLAATALVQNATPTAYLISGLDSGYSLGRSFVDGQGVYLYFDNASGDITGGDASNSFSVTAIYSIVEI